MSDIVSGNPKIVKIFNLHRGKFGFVHYEKQSNMSLLVDAMGYQIYLDIKEKETKIRVQPMILTQRGWMEIEDERSGVATGKDHLLFKPLPDLIVKAQEIEEQKAINKLEEKFLKDKTTEVDPLSILYDEVKGKAIDEIDLEDKAASKSKRRAMNPELIDYTKAHWDDEEPISEEKKQKSPWREDKEEE